MHFYRMNKFDSRIIFNFNESLSSRMHLRNERCSLFARRVAAISWPLGPELPCCCLNGAKCGISKLRLLHKSFSKWSGQIFN